VLQCVVVRCSAMQCVAVCLVGLGVCVGVTGRDSPREKRSAELQGDLCTLGAPIVSSVLCIVSSKRIVNRLLCVRETK